MIVRLTQLDGKLPNLALMKLSHWHKSKGDTVHFTKHTTRQLDEVGVEYDRVYGSAIFGFSKPAIATFRHEWPSAILGGTGVNLTATVEDVIGAQYEHYDYSIRPDYAYSLGFTQRGCRLTCGFCVVPKKEGRPKSINTIAEIWRGSDHPKKICLLDNDFFGQPRAQWEARIAEIRDGGYKVCFNQGLNVRLLDPAACAALATIPYYDDQFQQRRLYTAWDNLKDEGIFFKGVDMLEAAGISPRRLMAYMLIGYDPVEVAEWRACAGDKIRQTHTRLFYRFERMVARGILPYPMVYNNSDRELKWFARWVIRRFYKLKNADGSLRFPWPAFTLEGLRDSKLGAEDAAQGRML
ncbi:MAG: hypothetical protein PHS14_00360 [Elusimicrobia bacterium]|nr:hypothetical protein [Elusimicrobiota bacterium]